MTVQRCPVCQSDQVIRDCRITANAASHAVTLTADTGAQGAPNSWWDKRPVAAGITRCHVCGACGFVMPAVEEPQKLWAAYQAATGK
jgi:hypothetical protein